MIVTRNLTRLLEKGTITEEEAERPLKPGSVSGSMLPSNILIGFGVVAVATGGVFLVPDALTGVVIGTLLLGGGLGIRFAGARHRSLLSSICVPVGALVLALASSPALADVRCVQERLATLGYDPGPIDGILGRRTADTAHGFASDYGLSLPALTAATSDMWCSELRYIVGGGAETNRRMIAAHPPDTRPAPGCLDHPAAGYSREIVGTVDGDELRLRISTQFAGAVESVTWRDREFINIFDHGRQISYAWGMDGFGECLNPTEPGSGSDLFSQTSTSELSSLCSDAPDRLTTVTVPAYWMAPGERGFCDRGASTAVNDTPRTSQRLTKTIEIGYAGIDNVIAFDATVTLERDYRSNGLEVPTAYLTSGFTDYWRFDPSTGELTRPESVSPPHRPWSFENVDTLPPIIATPDGAYAMGAYTADPIVGYEILFYDVPNPADRTSKWNIIARQIPAPAGDYRYRSFAIVGTLESVQEAMRALYRLHPTDFHPPEGYVDVANCEAIEGWAWDPKAPNSPIDVEVYDVTAPYQHTLLATVRADRLRPDLPPVLGDDGRHGYSMPISDVPLAAGERVLSVEAANSVAGLANRALSPSAVTLDCR